MVSSCPKRSIVNVLPSAPWKSQTCRASCSSVDKVHVLGLFWDSFKGFNLLGDLFRADDGILASQSNSDLDVVEMASNHSSLLYHRTVVECSVQESIAILKAEKTGHANDIDFAELYETDGFENDHFVECAIAVRMREP
jgi:hypothetical protein